MTILSTSLRLRMWCSILHSDVARDGLVDEVDDGMPLYCDKPVYCYACCRMMQLKLCGCDGMYAKLR